MPENLNLFSSVNSRFGWPKPKRLEEFSKLLAAPDNSTHRLEFQGKIIDLPIIRVPIDTPKYRLANGRTASLQEEYIAKEPNVRQDLFTGDPELWDAQETQHRLLLQLSKQADLAAYFEDPSTRQVDPLLLDEYGYVVNGNRRLATWRELLHSDSVKYGHYQYIDVVILPHCDEREIDRLEAKLQITRDIRADYSWDAQANMMLAKQKRDGFSNKELGELYDMKESEVQRLFDMRAYAEEYLKSRGKPNHWSLVADKDFAFQKIVASRPKIATIGKQEIFKESAFVLLDKPDEVGIRLYEAIPSVFEFLDEVRNKLLENYNVVVPQPENDELTDIFGTPPFPSNEDPRDIPLSKEIKKPENVDNARKIIVDVIESQRQLKKDAKSANYLIDCCAKAQAALAAAVKDGLRPEAKLDGVLKQLAQIQDKSEQIREFVKKHAKYPLLF